MGGSVNFKRIQPRRRRSRGRQVTPIGYLEKRRDGWWIVMPMFDDMGPYGKEADADEDWLGMTHCYLDHKEYWDAARQQQEA